MTRINAAYISLIAFFVTTFSGLGLSKAESKLSEKALADFEKIVGNVKRELPGKKILVRQDQIYYLVWIDSVEEVTYDVVETRSLVSPFTGVINVFLHARTNNSSEKAGDSGFISPSAAIAASDRSDFRDAGTNASYEARYAYQSAKWVLKNAEGGRLRGGLFPDLVKEPAVMKIFLP